MTEYPQAVELIIMRGLPASGKTYDARRMMADTPGEYKRVSKDLLREMLDFGKYSQPNELVVLHMRDDMVMWLLADHWSVIADDCNLNPEHEQRLRKVAKEADTDVVVRIQDFTDVPVGLCIERDDRRAEPVGPDVIRSMARKYLSEEPDDA